MTLQPVLRFKSFVPVDLVVAFNWDGFGDFTIESQSLVLAFEWGIIKVNRPGSVNTVCVLGVSAWAITGGLRAVEGAAAAVSGLRGGPPLDAHTPVRAPACHRQGPAGALPSPRDTVGFS